MLSMCTRFIWNVFLFCFILKTDLTKTLTGYNFLNISPNELILFPTSLKFHLVYFKIYLKIFWELFLFCVYCLIRIQIWIFQKKKKELLLGFLKGFLLITLDKASIIELEIWCYFLAWLHSMVVHHTLHVITCACMVLSCWFYLGLHVILACLAYKWLRMGRAVLLVGTC